MAPPGRTPWNEREVCNVYTEHDMNYGSNSTDIVIDSINCITFAHNLAHDNILCNCTSNAPAIMTYGVILLQNLPQYGSLISESGLQATLSVK